MKKKHKPKAEEIYKKPLSEIAEQIASARAYREMKHPSVKEFLEQSITFSK